MWPFLACSSRSWSAEIRCLRVTELWLSVCRHWYTDPQSMFNGRYTFDTMTVAKDSYVFASEYAVFDWGISTIPRGNIQVRSPLPCHFKSCHAQVMTLCLVWVLYPYSEAMVVILSIFVFLPD